MKSIRTFTAYCLIAALLLASLGCANMTESQQRATSGALIGAVGGAAIAGIAGGNAAVGAGVGAAAGGLTGYIIGEKNKSKQQKQ